MTNTTSGPVGNLASFDQLIGSAQGFNSQFKPANQRLTLTAIQAKSSAGHDQIANHNAISSVNKLAIESRMVIFEPLDSIVTRIFNIVKSSDASQVMIDGLAPIVRDFQGKRAGKKLPPLAAGEDPTGPKQISVSQRGYNDRLNNFDKIICRLDVIPEYTPNEPELTVTSLRNYYIALDTANKGAIKTQNDLSNATISRDKEFCEKQFGLIDTGKAVKLYIKGVFGAKSREYRQVSKITFRKYLK